MTHRSGRPQGRHDARLHRRGRNRAGDGHRGPAEPHHAGRRVEGRRLSRRRRSPSAAASPPASPSRSPAITPRPRSLPGESLVEFRLADERRRGSRRRAPSSRSTCSRPARSSTSRARRSARAIAGVMKRHNFAGGLAAPRRLGVRTARRARSASARRRAACSRASACPATWATCAAPIENLQGRRRSTSSATCCWSAARCRARRAAEVDRASVGQGRARSASARVAPSSRPQARSNEPWP